MSDRRCQRNYRQFNLFLAAIACALLSARPAYTQQPDEAKQAAEAQPAAKQPEQSTADEAGKPAKGKEARKAKEAKSSQGEGSKSAEPAADTPRGKAAKSKRAGKPADHPAPEPVAVDPNEDPDFALLGEFAGPISTTPAKYQRLALQVRPLGGGNFEALQYAGGLPGEPSHRRTPVTLIGRRSEDFLVLSGGPWALVVERDHCLVLDRQGQHVGRLERVVRQSPTLGAQPPKDAIVLFEGKDTSQLVGARMTEDGLLMEGANIRPMLQDFNLHLEFLIPYVPAARDQGRGNSGIYLQSRYELQILDSFAEEPRYNGCGSIYRFREPDVNMSLPPLAWQTYDIAFTAPRWGADGVKLGSARATIWHNGVKIHNHRELSEKTGAGKPEEPTLLPTFLQNHKNPVRFRNIWVVDRGAAPPKNFPATAKRTDAKAER